MIDAISILNYLWYKMINFVIIDMDILPLVNVGGIILGVNVAMYILASTINRANNVTIVNNNVIKKGDK